VLCIHIELGADKPKNKKSTMSRRIPVVVLCIHIELGADKPKNKNLTMSRRKQHAKKKR